MTTDKNEQDELFAARVRVGLRELDGVEQSPDVAVSVAQRLAEPVAHQNRKPVSWLTVAAALLGVGVTATLLVQPEWGKDNPPASSLTQDPKGPWRLVYEFPIDELQRAMGSDPTETLEQVLDRCVRGVAARLGSRAVVTRNEASTFTVVVKDAAAAAKVRGVVETTGRLEMRMVADEDFAKGGVRFDLAREKEQLRAWLEAGGRARMLANVSAINGYRAVSDHLQWHVHRVRPRVGQPGRWGFALFQTQNDAVLVSSDADWGQGVVPAHLLKKPAAEQVLLELVPVNMFEQHFVSADFNPAGSAVVDAPGGLGGVAMTYEVLGEKAAEFADWSSEHTGKCCATIWDGEVIQAPVFRSKITRRGLVSGLDRGRAELMVSALTSQLPAAPVLRKSEVIAEKK